MDKVGIEVDLKAYKAFIPHTKIPNNYIFNDSFQSFINQDNPEQQIKKNSIIIFRVKNINIRKFHQKNIINLIGDIKEDYLGIVNN